MAEKSFGIKEIKFFGSSPKIESPNNLNLNAVNVAISTNATIGGTLSVTGNVSVGGTLTYEDVTNIDSVGLVTAREGVFIPDNKTLKIGNTASNPDFIFYHDGTSTILTNNMNGTTGAIVIQPKSGADGIKTFPDGAAELYFNSNKKLETSNTGVTVTGTLVATTFSGSGASLTSLPAANLTGTLPAISGANLTNLPAATPTNSDIQVVYTVTANGASAYRFAGNGVVSTADDPDLYLIRGQKYRFINNSGGSHPFQIRTAAGADGVAYSTGVTNNGASSGNIDFAPTYDSPAQLVYQCTSHSGMVGNIYLRDAAGNDTNVGVTTFVTNTDGTTNILTLHADANGTNNGVASIKLMGNTGNHAAFIKGGHTTNGDTILTFHTDAHASGINPEERLRIDSDGKIGINNNNPQYSLDIVGDQINLQSNASASNAVVRLRGENASTGGAIVAMNSAGNSGPLELWNGGVKSFSIGSDNTPAFFSPAVAWHEGPAVLEASNGYAEIFFRSTGSTHGTSVSGTWGIGKLAGTDGFAILKHGATGGGAVRVDAALSISNTNYITFGKTTRSPKQIGFLVRAGRGGDGYTNNPYQFHTVIKNETSGLSGGWDTTGKTAFTAPVTGFYYFSAHAAYGQTNVSFGTRILRYNSSNSLQDSYELYRFIQGSAGSHYGGSGSIALPLDAGDYVLLQPQYTPYHLNANLNFFSGFLIG